MLHQKGHEVYYTDSSDSVFTSGLLEKGIGRILYPEDLRWFTPNMVLLDYELKEKLPFYQEHSIIVILVIIQLLNNIPENESSVPVVYLPPSTNTTLPLRTWDDNIFDWLPAIKENRSNIVIIGLLEERKRIWELNGFYEVIKKSCMMNPQYQIILLTNSEKNIGELFSLPDNLIICRSVNLPSVLPFCDVALITGDLNTMIEGIYANLPSIVYPVSRETEHNHHIKEYVKQGLGIHSETKKITPGIFEQQIIQVIQSKKNIQKNLLKIKNMFENESMNLELVIERLIKAIEI